MWLNAEEAWDPPYPLKRASIKGVDRGMDGVMELCLVEMNAVVEDKVCFPWWQGKNVHWYIIGAQYTVSAFQELA